MNKIELPEAWVGWSFQDQFLIDEAHNKYKISDIRALFFQRQLQKSLVGDQMTIRGLKQELEDKIKALNSEIVIKLVNDEEIIKEIRFNI